MLSPRVTDDVVVKIARASVACERATNVPAELLFAQCVLESGWLSHAPGNNCFGIKSYEGELGRQLLSSTEYFTPDEFTSFLAARDGRAARFDPQSPLLPGGRRRYFTRDWFATFASLADCFVKRAELFSTAPYVASFEAYLSKKNLSDLIDAIAPIYATDPEYARTLKTIVAEKKIVAAISDARAALASTDVNSKPST